MVTLFERGAWAPCEMLGQIKPELESNLGNVREHDYDIPAMLQLAHAKSVRRHIVDTHCSCSYECAALCNTVLDVKQWPVLTAQVLKP